MRLKSRRAAHLLVSTAAVLATLTACGPPSNLPHVTMVGDSTLAGMVWYDQAGVTRSQDVVRAAYDLTLDAESCRRLVAPSCRGRFGYVPNTTMDVLRANRGRLGEAVVIMGGYDDISIGDAVPQILAETEAQGVKHVIWLTYPLNVPYVLPSGFPARSLYANHNLVLYLNSINHPTLHLADWNTYSAGHREWFGTDGIHLTAAGTMALASYLRAQLDQYVVIPPATTTSSAAAATASAGDDRATDDGGRHDDAPPRPSRPRRRPDGQGSRYSPPGARTARPSATTPAATRAARTSSSGQPMVLPRWAALTGPRPRARTKRPRPWRSEPTKGDCGRLVCADPDAGSGAGHPAADHEHDRAHGQDSHCGPRARQTVAPRSSRDWFQAQPSPSGTAASASAWTSPGPQRAARPAGPGPSDVGVDDGHVGLEGERHDRPGRVRPDAGQVLQIGDRPREDPAEVPLDRSRRGVQPDGAAVVAETAPQPEQVAGGRRRALGRGREPLHHLEEAGDDPRHLRLLQHGLGHEDGPRVAGPTPRQVAPPGLAPLQQRAPIVLVHAPLRDQLQAACSS